MKYLLILILAICAGCAPVAVSAPPQPTPQIIIKTIEIPGPTFTIVPQVCKEAIDMLQAALFADMNMWTAESEKRDPTDAEYEAFKKSAEDTELMFKSVDKCLVNEIGT